MLRSIALLASPLVLVCAVQAQTFGSVAGSFPTPATVPTPVGLDHDLMGNLKLTGIGTDTVDTIDLTGVSLATFLAAQSGNAIGVTTDGTNLYVTDTDAVLGPDVDVYDLVGNYISSFPVGTETTFPEGIAWNPNNNHLYVVNGSGGNQVHEYDLAGVLQNSFPILGSSPDGIAYDPARNGFWIYDSGTDLVRFYNAAFVEQFNFAGTGAAGFGTGEGLGLIGNSVYVCATGADTIVEFNVDPNTAVPAGLRATTEAALNSTGLSGSTPQEFEDGWFLRWNLLDVTGVTANDPALVVGNLGSFGQIPVGVTALLPGFNQLWVGSNPPGVAFVLPPFVVGGAVDHSFQIPPGILTAGDTLRIQGLSLHGTVPVPIAPTPETIELVHRDPVNIQIVSNGANSFNSNTAFGFFSVEHVSTSTLAAIQSVTFDWVASSNPAQATMVFDTDQTGMADVFEGGNSALTGCLGTYRNGSDAATGLVYDAMNTVPATPCDPAANTGWIGTNPTTAANWRTLEFRFTSFGPGNRFEFDTDTDGGAGIGGDDMAGMVVTIVLVDSTVLTGEIVAAGTDLGRLRF